MFGKVGSGDLRLYKTGEESTTITSVRSSPSIVVRELQVETPQITMAVSVFLFTN